MEFDVIKIINEFALAFLLSQEGNSEKIKYLEKSLGEVLDALPEIDFDSMTEEEYFNLNYSHLSNHPGVYGYFQFKFILDLIDNKKEIDINTYFTLPSVQQSPSSDPV